MIFFILSHLAFVLFEAVVLFVHVLESVDVNIRDFQSPELFVFDRLEAQVERDTLILGLREELSHIHPVLHFLLLPFVRIKVFRSSLALAIIDCTDLSRPGTLRFPIVVHELQGVLELLLHLSIITGVPCHQVQG